MMHLGDTYSKCDRFADAEQILRECLEIRDRKEPELYTTFHTMSLLGGALLRQKKVGEAESLLVKGYEGMKDAKKRFRHIEPSESPKLSIA